MTATSPTALRAGTSGDVVAALGWMLVALFAFSAFAIGGREAGRELTTAQIMFWRGPLSLPILVVIGFSLGLRPVTQRLPMHVLRAGFHYVSQFTWLSALNMIPMAELFALEFTAPLWVAVLAPAFLGERLTRTRLLAAFVGFVGILLVVRPGSQAISTGTLYGLAAAVGFACSMMTTKVLTRTESPFTILFYMMIFQTIFGVLAGLPTFRMPTPLAFFWLAAIAVSGLVAHYCMAQAFRKADTILVAPMDFLRLPLIAAIAGWLYGEHLDAMVFAGAGVIIIGNLLNLRGERRRVSA